MPRKGARIANEEGTVAKMKQSAVLLTHRLYGR